MRQHWHKARKRRRLAWVRDIERQIATLPPADREWSESLLKSLACPQADRPQSSRRPALYWDDYSVCAPSDPADFGLMQAAANAQTPAPTPAQPPAQEQERPTWGRGFAEGPAEGPIPYLHETGVLRDDPYRKRSLRWHVVTCVLTLLALVIGLFRRRESVQRRFVGWHEILGGVLLAVVVSGFVMGLLRAAGCPW